MKKFYTNPFIFIAILIIYCIPQRAVAQACSSLSATYIITESRCASTGRIQINAAGGSGNYQYKADGPLIINYTTSSILTGLPAGRYLITVKDISTNCVYNQDSVTVPGNYLTPGFTMLATGVTCINGNNGMINVNSVTFGRAPFSYKIVAPSASGVGTISATGSFTGLIAGNYLIQLSDSCGAIQTRGINISNYDWFINTYTATKIGCDTLLVTFNLRDSKGNVTPNAVFSAFTYGASVTPGDTTWYTTNTFRYYKGKKRSVRLLVKDGCGNIKTATWTETVIPTVGATVTITNRACSTFTATITGQVNLTAPSYCVYNSSNVLISCNSTGVFNALPYGNYCIRITDNCYDTVITRCFTSVSRPVPAVGAAVTIVKNCNFFNVAVTGQVNISNGNYCLYNSANVLIVCNTTGNFTNVPYGDYCIRLVNNPACYDTTIVRCFSASRPVPSVNAAVQITNLTCSTFTASITDTVNLSNPQFCLYTPARVLIVCNTTGIFNNLPYGSYCIDVVNNAVCYDTTITRCFNVVKPVPAVGPLVTITNRTCIDFTASLGGQSNLNNPQYCLYNAANVLIGCNATGVFNNLPYGTYCINAVNDPLCYDTTITRCFTVTRLVPVVNAAVTITNKNCTGFSASITGQVNINNAQYCLFTAARVLVGCNTTGVFNNVPYGNYCIDVINDPLCYDTVITRCFTVTPPVPAIASAVAVSSRNCTSFTATITGQTNIYNPQYCLYNSANVLISCNTTGVFTGIPYGSYCIDTKNDAACYDTTIRRCFTVTATVLNVSLSASRSCNTIGTSDLRVNISTGTPGYSISLFSPAGIFMQTLTTSGTSVTFLNVPNLTTPLRYTIIATDNCNKKDTDYIAPRVYRANRAVTFVAKCPSAAWPNGASDVVIDISDNNIGGSIVPKIIKKNGAVVSINANSNTGYRYTFLDLGPATYIFDTDIDECDKHLYDTVIVAPYIYPDLFGSRAFQCDNSSFNVNVNTVGGKAPYMYEIFGSAPALPSIITTPQASPVFNINNGASYSLVRLRVVDACGNASLQDASVLPLANFVVFPDTVECFNHSLTLRVDSIANAVYTWYKRIVPNDSVIVSTGPSYHIPNLAISDTGRYFCKVVVNNGCIIKYANYVLTGFCNAVLPVDFTLTGVKDKAINKLYWNNINGLDKQFVLQRSNTTTNNFQNVNTPATLANGIFAAEDTKPFAGNNYYRLKIISFPNPPKYSNTILIKNANTDISCYPNPVNGILFIAVANQDLKNYVIDLYNMMGKKMYTKTFYNIQNAVISYPRTGAISAGVYTLVITDVQSNERQTFKIVYK